MAEYRVESFTPRETPIADFFSLPQRIEGLTDHQAQAEAAGTRALLDPGNTYYRTADSRSFVVRRGGAAVGRLTAFHNRLLAGEHRRFGLVGLFACENDATAARLLVEAASAWLGEQGLDAIRGPMAGDIWHRWRFMTRGFDTEPFAGEPRNPPHYPELISACGFAAARTYSTKLVTDLAAAASFSQANSPTRPNRRCSPPSRRLWKAVSRPTGVPLRLTTKLRLSALR